MAFTIIPSIFLFLNHRASDDFVETRWSFNARWALIFIPYWVGLIVTVCGSCISWGLSVIDLHTCVPADSKEDWKGINRVCFVSCSGLATSFLARSHNQRTIRISIRVFVSQVQYGCRVCVACSVSLGSSL